MNDFEDIDLNFDEAKLLNFVGYAESNAKGTIWETSKNSEIEASSKLLEVGLIKLPPYLSGIDIEGNPVGQYQLTEKGKEYILYLKGKNDGWVGGSKMDYEL